MNDSHRLSDCELYIACCHEGSEEQAAAYTELYEGFFRVALNMVAGTHHSEPEALAADCAQEALVKVHAHLAEVRTPDSFRSWAGHTLRNHVLNRIKQWRAEQAHIASKHSSEDDGESEDSPATHPDYMYLNVENAELAIALGLALTAARLSDRSRWVVAGRYLLDVEDRTLAAQLTEMEGCDILPSHVQTTRSKNLAKLRRSAQARKMLAPWLA